MGRTTECEYCDQAMETKGTDVANSEVPYWTYTVVDGDYEGRDDWIVTLPFCSDDCVREYLEDQ